MRDATVLAVGGTGASGARLDRAARRGVALAAALAGVALAALAFSPPPAAAQDPGSVLLYTGTTGFRHTDAINNGRPVVQTALEDAGYTVTWEDCNGFGTGAGQCRNADENPRVFTEANLANYDAILLLNASDYFSGAGGTPGQLWNASEEAAIIDFVQNGGGVAAVHNMVDAGAGQTTWDWWDGGPNSVVGSIMTGHAATDINNTADVQVADRNHLSTRDLPDVYEFGDEHYSWQRNVRGDHHVLATLDESTYNLGSSASMGNDHPISWCKLYDGDNVNDGTGTPKPYDDGRTWLTAMGHFGASYTANGGDNNLVDHIVGGVRWVAGEGLRSDCSGTVWSSFTRTILVDDANGPIDIDIAADGKVYWSEIGPIQGFTSEGYIKMHDQSGAAGNTTTVATIPTRADHSNSEDGVLGMALEPGFDLSDPTKRDLYVYYSPRNPAWPTSGNAYVVGYNVISRFTLNASGTAVVPGSEQEILRVPKVKLAGNPTWCTGCPSGNGPGHVGGAALEFDSDGNLYLGVGDDVSPNEAGHNAYPPLDYRAQEHRDARKTAANTGDLRGKIVRVHPLDEIAPGAEPGIGTTYSIPEGNLFAPGTADARPEIYAMGFRQPFTVHTDPANPGTIGVGEYCHDNSANMANRAPAGVCEWNLISEPGFHGWPFCVGPNNPANTSYRWDYASGTSTGSQYDCSLAQIPSDLDYAPTGQTNPGPTNPGLANIPGPAVPATIWKKYTNEQGNQFGDLGPGGMQPITGPIYRYDPETAGPGAFPAYYDGSWLIHNRGSDTGFWKDVRLRSDNNQMLEVYNFLPANQFGPPNNGLVIPVDFGPDGALYMGRFQVGCCRNEIEPGDITEIVKIEFNVQDECLEDTQAPNVSHQVAGQPHPTEPDTYLIGGLEDSARLTVTANDVGCAGVDQVEYRVNSDSEDDWQPYTGQVPFTEAGEFAVDYRATDDFGNTSEIGTATFTVAEANDTAAPAVEATVSGSQNEDGDYIESATLALEATDAISGIESIEHSVNGGAFIETSFDGSNPSESTQVEFDELGEYTVEYRATDTSGNTSTVGEVSFTVVAGDGCVGVRSDEFDGDMLDPERWTTVRNPLEYPPVVGGGSLTLPILDEVDGTRTGPFSYVAQQVPEGDWSATTRVTVNLDLYDSWHQAGLILWQSDGNFVKYVFGRDANSGELRVEMASDNPTDQRETGDNAPIDPGTQTVWLRLNREGNTIFGELALDEGGEPGEWMAPAIQTRPVDTNPPREGPGVLIGLFAGSDVNPPPYEGTASFDFFRIEPDEQNCPDDTTPPETTAQLNGADPEPTYDGPVEVTLSATDPGGGSEPQTHQVTAEGFVWDPDALEAAAGDTVEWDFSGGFHDICLGADEPAEVTAGSCGTDEELGDAADTPPDTGGSKTFPEPGSFVYYCTYHFPSMVGDLTVTEGGGTPGSGVAETSYSLDGGAPVVSENTAGSDPFVTEFAVSEPGSHEVDYFSTDEAGNVEATESVSFEIEEGGGEPELRLGVSPSRDRVRVGQTAAFTATVRNTGDGSASNLRVCVKAPKSKLRVVGKECVRSGTLDPGERMTPRFRLKPKRSARGDSVRVTFTATAAGLGMERDTATVKVKR